MRYEKKGDVVIDHQTGLIWQANCTGPMEWENAVIYSRNLGDGWRLPEVSELITIINYERYFPASDFPGIGSERHWSSSSDANDFSHAWYVDFDDGYVSYSARTYYNYVRCCQSSNQNKIEE